MFMDRGAVDGLGQAGVVDGAAIGTNESIDGPLQRKYHLVMLTSLAVEVVTLLEDLC